MFCGKCGQENPAGASFCSACGNPLGAASPGGTAATPPGPSAYPAPPSTSGTAVASLVCGFLFFFLPAALAAVILGHLSLREIRKSAGRITGQGIAVGGLVLGYLGIALVPLFLIGAAILIPNLIRARIAANQAAAVGSLREIAVAATSYAASYNNGFPPDLESLGGTTSVASCDHAGLINGMLAGGTRSGYVFTYTPTEGDSTVEAPKTPGHGCSTLGSAGYTIQADPVNRGTTGQASYFVDSTGVIRVEQSQPATAASAPLK